MESERTRQGRLAFETAARIGQQLGDQSAISPFGAGWGDLTNGQREAWCAVVESTLEHQKEALRLRDVTSLLLAEQCGHADVTMRSQRVAAHALALLAGLSDVEARAQAYPDRDNEAPAYLGGDGVALTPIQTGFYLLRLSTIDPTLRFIVVAEDGGVCGDAIVVSSAIAMRSSTTECNRFIHTEALSRILKVQAGEITPVNHDGDRMEFIHDSLAEQISKG